jgi:hypothetical protein
MTLSAGTVSLGVKPNTAGFGRSLSSGISSETSGLGDLGKKLGGLLVAGIAAVGIGKAVGGFIRTGFAETMDASAGVAQLTAGIKSTGNAANVSVKGMEDLASSIQGYSGQTDDSIVASEQLLLTFTNIKNVGANKIFDDATKAAANMAAKFGGDAASQSVLLGKALNDPVKGITALTRVGVSFTEKQKATIAAMVKTGNTIGAQKIILGELNTEFGGAAEAAGTALPGQLARLRRGFEDVAQSVVEKVRPALGDFLEHTIGLLKKVSESPGFSKMVEKLAGFADKSAGKLQTLFEKIEKVFSSGSQNPLADLATQLGKANPLLQVMLTVTDALKSVFPALKTALEQIAPALIPLLPVLADAVTQLLPAFVQIILALLPILPPLVQLLLALAPIITAVATAVAFLITNFAGGITFIENMIKLLGTGKASFSDYISLFGQLPGFLRGLVVGGGSLVFGIINGAIDAINTLFDLLQSVPNAIRSVFGLPNQSFHIAHMKNFFLGAGTSATAGAKSTAGGKVASFATGGTIMPTPGGSIVRVAEAGRAETIVDTATLQAAMKSRGNGDTFNVYETTSPYATALQIARRQKAVSV